MKYIIRVMIIFVIVAVLFQIYRLSPESIKNQDETIRPFTHMSVCGKWVGIEVVERF